MKKEESGAAKAASPAGTYADVAITIRCPKCGSRVRARRSHGSEDSLIVDRHGLCPRGQTFLWRDEITHDTRNALQRAQELIAEADRHLKLLEAKTGVRLTDGTSEDVPKAPNDE